MDIAKTVNIENFIISTLKDIDINYDLLNNKQKKQFLELENYINHCSSIRLESLKNLKDINLNIKKISDNTSISKATIYNNKNTLKKYIDKRLSDINLDEENYLNTILYSKYNFLKNKYDEANELIGRLTKQLIDINNLKVELKMLEEENSDLSQKIDILTNDKINLQNEIDSLKKILYSLNNKNIINFEDINKK
nr:hypothetical protein [uncultured Romboutsia sp.]